MASHLDAADESTGTDSESTNGPGDRIDDHLRSALEAPSDDGARYHLREALQLQIVEMQGHS